MISAVLRRSLREPLADLDIFDPHLSRSLSEQHTGAVAPPSPYFALDGAGSVRAVRYRGRMDGRPTPRLDPRADSRIVGLRRVAAARFISRTGGEAAFFVGIWGKAAYELRATPVQLAAVMASLAIAAMAGGLIAGMLVDRFDPRRVLLAGEVLFIPTTLGMIWVGSIPALVVMAALHGLVIAPVFTAVSAMPPFMTDDPARLDRLNAWIGGAGSAAFVLGPALGALIVARASISWVFVLDAATSLVAVALVWPLRLRRPEAASGSDAAAPQRFRDGIRQVYSSRGLRYFVLMGTAMWLGFGAFGAIEPLFYRDVLGRGVETIGWVNSIFGIGMLAGAALLPRLPRSALSARGLAIAATLTGLGGLLYVGTRDLRVVVGGAVVWGLIIGAADPLLRTLIQSDSPDEMVGRVAGTAQVHQQAGELIPLAIAPALAARFGVQPILIGSVLGLAAISALSWGEAVAVDRTERLRPISGAVSRQPAEPVSPNP